MGLIRIAFGRSLSSYLTFLQGTMVSLQESVRTEKMNILELHHKSHDMGEILGRLARLCQCHVIHDRDDTRASRFGFYLPPGADLLSMLYNELMEEPGVSNPIWTALLTTLLDHASKPYRDILSRWLGITPSAYAGHDRTQLSQLSSVRRRRSANWNNMLEQGSSLISIFDCHLQQSLQGLDPFGEFFIQSKHDWSWDGSEPIILGDPLDYDGEFQWNDRVSPPSFIGKKLAQQIVQVGKELQILVEFEPRHPLIAHDRQSGQAGTGLKWLYLQKDIAKLGWKYKKSSNQVLLSVAARLESMGWISKRRARYERNHLLWRRQKLMGKQRQRTESEESSFGDSFQSEIAGLMDIDIKASGSQPVRLNSFELEPSMDPNLQGFFSLSTTLGDTKDMSLACPDMMEFLLKPTEKHTGYEVLPTALQSFKSQGPPRSRLESMAPLNILAEQCLADSIRTRASLISTCVMSLYFHDLNLLSHFDIMKRFQLLSDAEFTSRIEEALFDEETGLLTQTARASLAGTSSTGSANVRRDSTTSNSSKSSLWRSGRLTWPPKSGELELALRAVLLECFQSAEYQDEMADEDAESDIGNMDVEESMTSIKTAASTEGGRESTWKRRKIDPHELEDMLAFAVKDYDDDSNISKDANEALDFLYMDYKAPRPLRLLFFTPEAFDKYSRLFTFQLRLLRVDSTLKRIYQRLRVRQHTFSKQGSSTLNIRRGRGNQQQRQPSSSSSSESYRMKRGWEIEMTTLHRFRFEAQQIFDGFRGYITDVAIGSTWNTFIQRITLVQSRIEARIMSSYSGPNSDEEFDPKLYTDEQEAEEEEEEEDHITSDGLCDLASLHEYHDYILDRMLLQSLLKRKQAPILKVIHGILSCILKLSQFVDSLPEPEDYIDVNTQDRQTGGVGSRDDAGVDTRDEELRSRLVKLNSLYEKFHSLCRMLVKVLKTLDERGLGMEGVSTSASTLTKSTSSSSVKQTLEATASPAAQQKFLQQLLLRLEMSGYYDNL
ncbi:hypothetical protein BGZ76_009708 [Entomortierella beljakovae]|nr:hypothetical protein BGZ76_009708 [Entomortierella beljakovae]